MYPLVNRRNRDYTVLYISRLARMFSDFPICMVLSMCNYYFAGRMGLYPTGSPQIWESQPIQVRKEPENEERNGNPDGMTTKEPGLKTPGSRVGVLATRVTIIGLLLLVATFGWWPVVPVKSGDSPAAAGPGQRRPADS